MRATARVHKDDAGDNIFVNFSHAPLPRSAERHSQPEVDLSAMEVSSLTI